MKSNKFGSKKGATFIEYALLAGLVAILVAAAVMIFGKDLKGLFSSTGEQVQKVDTGVKAQDLSSGFSSASDTSKSTK